MWSDADFSSVGGGGFNAYDSPAPTAAPDNNKKRHSFVVPVAIKQILDNKEETLQIGGLPVTMMEIVGIVKSVNISSTKIHYTVEDWSGVINGMLWLEGDSNDPNPSNVIENTYCKMTGTVRRSDNDKVIFIYNIRPIEDFHEISYHYLQIIAMPLKAEESRRQVPPSEMDTSDGMNLPREHAKVYGIIKTAKSEAGMNKNEISQYLKMSPVELDKIIEFLITEGHVYCTIDDDHFKVTDS